MLYLYKLIYRVKITMFRKAAAVILSFVLITGAFVFSASAGQDRDYAIENPYEAVDWSSWGQYRASLHNHTTVSDGDFELSDMVKAYYDLGYDFLAITDHSTTCYSWIDVSYVPAIRALMSLRNGSDIFKAPKGLTNEEYEEITTPGADGKYMLQVPFGNEQNGGSFNNAHINTWFADYGNGRLGATSDYDSVLAAIDGLGGLSVINHPGEYTGARDADSTEEAYGDRYGYYIEKFEQLLLKYPSCLGIDINSKGDGRTRYDRKLWDIMLQDLIPAGRSVYALASSDAHGEGAVDTGWTVNLMPEKTVDGLKSSLENGTFFAASHCIKNPDELAVYSAETGLDPGSEWEADKSLPDPKVTSIEVDDDEDTITIKAENASVIVWVADGKTIASGETIDLDDYSEEIGSYVRAEIFGEGGILYTQAFVLDYDGAPENEIDDSFIDYGFIFQKLYNLLVETVSRIEPLRQLFNMLLSQNL